MYNFSPTMNKCLIDKSIIVLFRQLSPCSTRYKSRTGLQYPALVFDPRNLLSACPHRQFHTLPGLLDSRAALSNFYPIACVQCRAAV